MISFKKALIFQNSFFKRNFLIVAFIFSFSTMWSQLYTIRGVVVGGNTTEPLESVTVYIESQRGNDLLTYTITNSSGKFELELGASKTDINLLLSHIGYKPKRIEMELSSQYTIELGEIKMEQEVEKLSGVTVLGERVPIVVKNDTLEFNADSFKTRPNGTLEELLKKLPGVDINKEGIRINGQVVNKILINGTSFFGDDLKIATKNIPKKIIDKVQFTSTKDEKEKFTGKEAASNEKTINVTIKKDMNKGSISRITGGYGTNDRYQANGIMNYLNNKERFTLLAGSNNINNPGFTFDEVYDMIGNKRGEINRGGNGSFKLDNIDFGDNEGTIKSYNLGASYANRYIDKSELSANYFFGLSEKDNDIIIARENILPDNRYFTDKRSSSYKSNNSHRVNGAYKFNIDSTLRASLEPKFIYTKNNLRSFTEERATSLEGVLNNNSIVNNSTDRNSNNFASKFEIIKKLGTQGGFLSFDMTNNVFDYDEETNYNSELNVVESQEVRKIDQFARIRGEVYNNEFNLLYRLAINNKKLFIDSQIDYGYDIKRNNRKINDLDESTGLYSDLNADLSSEFKYNSYELRPKIGLNYEGDKFSFGLNSSYKSIRLNQEDALRSQKFKRKYDYVFLGGRFKLKLGKNKSFYIDYNVDNGLPSLLQLQDVDDLSNPQNIISGNTDLRPETIHTTRFTYRGFNSKNKSNMFIFSQAEFTNDKIAYSIDTQDDLVRRTSFNNVQGNYRMFGSLGINKTIKKDSISTIKLSTLVGYAYTRSVTINNGSNFVAKTFRLLPRIGLVYSYRDIFDFEPSYKIIFNNTKFNLEGVPDVDFRVHDIQFQATLYWPKGIVLGNDISLVQNNRIQDGFVNTSFLWNFTLGVELFKGKGSIKLTAYDLLKQNNNVRRITTYNYIEDRQSLILQRYFMLSFTHNINTLGKSKK